LLSFEKYLFFIPTKSGPPSGVTSQAHTHYTSFFLQIRQSTGCFLKNNRFVFFKAVKIVKKILPAFVSSKRHKGNKATRQQERQPENGAARQWHLGRKLKNMLNAEHLPETGNWRQRTGNREL
jgi:hypothetical protein